MIRILTVCTGNICRSPYAEMFLQTEFDRVSPGSFSIRSAGTHALAGHEMDERSAARLEESGSARHAFVARQFTADMTDDVDLVLALTDKQRSNIVALSPKLLKRTYTVREFAAVVDEVISNSRMSFTHGRDSTNVDARWAALLKAAPLNRHGARVKLGESLDVVDPYQQSDAVYTQMVSELLPALRTIVRFELLPAT